MAWLKRNGYTLGLLLALGVAGSGTVGCDSSASGPDVLCDSDAACDDGDACTVDSCEPETGCTHEPIDVAAECDDGNPCTADSCDAEQGCVHDGSGVDAACDDGDACTADDVCQGDAAGTCAGEPLAADACDDGNVCTADSCDAEQGCVHDGTGITAPCDDGSVCTEQDVCQGDAAGTCAGVDVSAELCDDGDPCTADSCDPEAGCQNEPAAGAACDDGDPCTSGDVCQADGSCAGGEPTDCDDGNVCTADSCDPEQGCVHDGSGITEPCDDHNVCTDDDVCRGDAAGTCAGTFRPLDECDDGNICTVDTCDPELGCVHDGSGISAACDDGDPCTSGDVCQGDAAGTCRGRTPTDCDDGNVCTADSCDPELGCINDGTGIHADCDDGNVCTIDDMCIADAAGTCRGADIGAELCDDGNACTTDTCDPVTGCENELMALHECFPTFVIDYPPRGATIEGQAADPTVTVTGTVTSGAGDITSFSINGVDVPLNPDGSFSQPVAARVGGNVLWFEASDSYGSYRERVQAFLWSTDYRKPELGVAGSGMVDEGMGIWLSQQVLDDGDHSMPPDDLATIFELVLDSFDLGSFIDPNTPIAREAGYDIYLTSLDYDTASASLTAIDGGMQVQLALVGIEGDLYFDCTEWYCQLSGGDSTGGLSMDSITVTADILLTVAADHTLEVTVANPSTQISDLDIWSNNWWTDFLISIVEVFIRDQLVSDLEDELNSQLTGELAPMLQEALSALAISEAFELPRLDGSGDTITVQLVTDFAFTDFAPGGGAIGLRTTGYAEHVVPYDNLGFPQRVGCGAGGQHLVIPGDYPFELVLADDMLNALFYAAWAGGLIEFPIPEDMLGDIGDLSQYGIENLQLDLSGMLAPTAADCNAAGELQIFLGDLRLHASMDFAGMPLDIIVWASATMGLQLAVADGELSIAITQIDGIETQLEVVQDQAVGLIDLIGSGFEDLLVDTLMEALGGGQLATIPLPAIDLSESVGLPPGTAVIALDPQDLFRAEGNTIIGGDLQQ